LVSSKDTICSCAYYPQLHMVSLLPTKFHEILFSSFRGVVLTSCFRSIFGEIFKFKGAQLPQNLGDRPVRLSVTVCQRNSSATTEQNFMKLGK
jgi:hypothetical protein